MVEEQLTVRGIHGMQFPGGGSCGLDLDGGADASGNGGTITLTPGPAAGSGKQGSTSLAGPVRSPVTPAQSLANTNTITLPTSGRNKLLTTGGNVTGIIMTTGRFDGEEVELINTSANSITFATAATSLVADGTSAVIAALTRMRLVWDASTSRWYHGN